jgi:hypothetical protein
MVYWSSILQEPSLRVPDFVDKGSIHNEKLLALKQPDRRHDTVENYCLSSGYPFSCKVRVDAMAAPATESRVTVGMDVP